MNSIVGFVSVVLSPCDVTVHVKRLKKKRVENANMSFFGKKKLHVMLLFTCWKKKRKKKGSCVGKKKRFTRWKKKKKVENANSGKRGFGMRIQTHT